LTFEPSRELAQWINEFSIEVLDASFNFALVLWVRRMRKMRLNTMLTAPVFPLLLKLRFMIRQNSLRKPLLLAVLNICAMPLTVKSFLASFLKAPLMSGDSLTSSPNKQLCSTKNKSVTLAS
jgi:hypothetical protein